VAYSERYSAQTGTREDLDKAVDCFERALALVPEGSLESATYFNNLADCLIDRYRAGNGGDLIRAIDLVTKALDLTRENRHEYPGYLMNLGNYLRLAYFESQDSNILSKAIKAYRESVRRTNDNAPDYKDRVHDLGRPASPAPWRRCGACGIIPPDSLL